MAGKRKAVYPASPLKRARGTKAEMEERAAFLIGYARQQAQSPSAGSTTRPRSLACPASTRPRTATQRSSGRS